MASHFQIQKPYVLTSLPRPLDPSTGRYVVGEVYGSTPGSKKRKRAELAIGTDGDSINIYEASSARLITSYPIPPQSSLTCAPSSIRRRNSESKDITRFTYVSTREGPSHNVILFKDLAATSGETVSRTESTTLSRGGAVTYLAPIRPLRNETGVANNIVREELVVVREDGEILGLDVESLEKKWDAPPKTLHKGIVDSAKGLRISPTSTEDFRIEFCCSALASDIVKGVFQGNEELVSLFPGEKIGNRTDSEVLVLVSSYSVEDQKIRILHVVGVSPQAATNNLQRLAVLYTGPLEAQSQRASSISSYHLDVLSGTLLELDGKFLTTYDLTASVPRASATMAIGEAASFLRLSKTSLLSASGYQLNVYNPIYRSLQSSTKFDTEEQPQAVEGEIGSPKVQLIAYFSRLELALAIVNSNLVAIQLEAPKVRAKKRRAEGLLIDAIGRGMPSLHKRQNITPKEAPAKSTFSNYLPGSIRGDYWQKWISEESFANNLLNSNDVRGLEKFLAGKFGVELRESKTAHDQNTDGSDSDSLLDLPQWKWPKNRASYSYADRRWVLYAISRAFEWNTALPEDETIPRLVCQLPQGNIVNYLVDAGHLTLSNIKSAFKLNIDETAKADPFIAEQLVTRLADLDPSLALLSAYISATTLGSIELLFAVRTIMRSLELVQDRNQNPPKLIANGSSEEEAYNGVIGMELDNLEEQIQKTESYLGGDAGVRGDALSAAFAKLGNCPNGSMIKALQSTFKPEEILSLVYILRVELVKGAWTSRYLDATDFEQDPGLDAPPDGIIKLLADLLGRCIDAIGPSGWLVNDAILAGDESGDFIAALKLEVSAALEGIEEAVYLRGVVGEAVKYGQIAEKQARADAAAAADTMKPIPLHVREAGAEALPLGLKTGRERISAQKVVSGGEIVNRSIRETGHLRSQQVGPYSLERIAI